ncbi:MAG: GGDEF domain-containing protein, partial [Clostridia bacterium]|nr:GGDEF domain-containing protein [Clostridia bacterium]
AYITYFGVFAILFSFYTFLETELALFLIKNSRFVYMAKFMLLCILQIPLMETIIVHILPKYRHVASHIVYFNIVNFIFQTFLHFTGNLDYCSMLPMTHIVTAVSFIPLLIFLLKTGVQAYPYLMAILPMYAGFITDAILINIGTPSYNNNFFFTIALSLYILFELARLLRMYVYKFHRLVESNTLETLAYTDLLTGLGNRNAYEEHIKSLSKKTPSETFGCIVSDLTDLKGINDTHGHGSGDLALIEISEAIRHQMPANASCFRTGGDEFVIMIDSIDEHALRKLAQRIKFDVSERAQIRDLPLLLAMGYGLYHPTDENVPDFVRRIDTLMYADKRAQKQKIALARAAKENKL